MANPKHFEILNQEIEAWNEWRKNNPNEIPDLSDANLRGADLCKAELSDLFWPV